MNTASFKELYENNVNIMQYCRELKNSEENNIHSIMTSYDLQSGSYVSALNSPIINENYHVNFKKTPMLPAEFTEKFTQEVANEINKYDFSSILEAGIGEATTLVNVCKKLINKNAKISGFDISPSRIQVAKEYSASNRISCNLFVADLNHIPLKDNSVDLIYTVHALEPNSNKEFELTKELYRVTNKYLILIEPSYELGNSETKANIEKHKYIKRLREAVNSLGGKILRYELFTIGTYSNQPAIHVIEKSSTPSFSTENAPDYKFVCPVCKNELEKVKGHNFCEFCGVVYPILNDIEILNANNSIIFSHYYQNATCKKN